MVLFVLVYTLLAAIVTGLVLFEVFVTNLLLFEYQQKNCSLADSFVDPMAYLNTAVAEGRMS